MSVIVSDYVCVRAISVLCYVYYAIVCVITGLGVCAETLQQCQHCQLTCNAHTHTLTLQVLSPLLSLPQWGVVFSAAP